MLPFLTIPHDTAGGVHPPSSAITHDDATPTWRNTLG